jgi:hydroxyacyl-ACP dehydratase HTD2-like protein with hotdog domain
VVERRKIDTVEYKSKGDMIFINQSRIIWNKDLKVKGDNGDEMWGVREIRTHVFRPPFNAASTSTSTDRNTTKPLPTPTPTMATKPDIQFTYTPTSPLLFRYSALTFNAHKIHYDHPHTLSHEAQPTLLVHGPLTATLLIELAVEAGRERGVELVGFEYRAVGPIFVDGECVLSGWWDGEGLVLEARQGERIGMKASAIFA